MQLRIRQLISLIALATFVSVGACKQEKLPTDGQSPTRTIGGGTDQAVLAETIVTVLFIARKQARDSGECDQSEQRQDPRSGEDRALSGCSVIHLRNKKPRARFLRKNSG